MSKNDLRRKSGESSGNATLFNDIDVLSKSLYEDKSQPRITNSTASSRSKSITKPHLPDPKSKSKINNEDRFLKDKKSIWSWNTFKSFTHVRNKRFNCCFSLHVHSIDNLPSSFNNLSLSVKWKRRDGELTTRPSKVSQGAVQFEETLTNTCSVYGSRSGPHHSAKYEAKHFLLYASIHGDPDVDLGKHRVDLTRLLPLTLEELEDEKSSGKWSTTYRLSGKAKGASMNVSFGYSVVDNGKSPGQSQSQSPIKRDESLPTLSSSHNRSLDDVKDLHEVLPVSKSELSESVSMLYKKLEEEKSIISIDYETKRDVQEQDFDSFDPDKSEFSIQEQGIEIPLKENERACENEESTSKDQNFDEKELIMQELELALNNVNEQESDSQEESETFLEEGMKEIEDIKIGYKEKGKSLKLDYATESVAEDFLNMLGIDHSPFSLTSESESNSPRERLLRQFEKESLNSKSLFNFNLEDDDELGFTSDSIWDTNLEKESLTNKTNMSLMEDMETEALMREFGLNEKVFERVPSNNKTQVDFSEVDLPPLGENLGSFVQTSNGGFLRSMSPEIFKNNKNGGNLIMQVSSPVVVPSQMGTGIMDVLQGLASVGIEKLSFQANKLMPLEDISGKTLEEIGQIAPQRNYGLGGGTGAESEYVSLEDLAPLAMEKIESLSIEGLKIQSGMSENDAPSNVNPKSIGEISALEGKMVNYGTGGLQLLDIKKNENGNENENENDEMDGMMGLSVTLDEWMKLDSGEIDESERTSRILTAHNASDLTRVKKGKRKSGLLGNNFTVALMVQLRNPLRNFEPVGTPMLALVQVERVFVPPKPKIIASVYSYPFRNIPEDENVPEENVPEENVSEENVPEVVKEKKEDEVAKFKVVEVHVAGVKGEESEGGKKGIWGGGKEKAGGRWLVANGMGKKGGKHALMKAKVEKGSGSFWSVSGKGKGKVEVAVRNPNVIIPNETVRLLSGAGFV